MEKKTRRIRQATFLAEDGTVIYEVSMKREIVKDGKTYKRVKRIKPPSRALRMSIVIENVSAVKDELERIRDEIQGIEEQIGEIGEDTKSKKKLEAIEKFREEIEGLCQEATSNLSSMDFSDANNLRDELDNWKSGMEGTNLEASNKYSMLEDAINYLEEGIGDLENITDTFDTSEDIDYAIDEIDNAISSFESVEFPGMFG